MLMPKEVALKKTLLLFAVLSLMLTACGSVSSHNPTATAEIYPSPTVIPIAIPTVTPTPLQYEFHVAVNGDDSNPGTIDKPFATLEHARDVIREISSGMQEPILVYVHGGTYFVREPIEFAKADSGQNGYDIIYRAAEGEAPVISGGIRVSGWEQVPDSQLWKAVLQDVNAFRQLYISGVRAQRAASQKMARGIHWVKGDTTKRDGILISASNTRSLTPAGSGAALDL